MPLPHQKEHGTADERSNSSSQDRTNSGETKSDADHREAIRSATLQSENTLLPRLIDIAALSSDVRRRAQEDAAAFIKNARASASRSSLIDKFLLEYGLSTTEGVTLMRLAEALLRTPDATTADALIKDKLEAGDWKAHAGRSPFPLVNVSTRGLMLTAAWLDGIEPNNPLSRFVAGTKSLVDRMGDTTIRAAVGQAMRIMGEHFVLGQTINEALKRAKPYAAQGYGFSYDMLGEAALTAADAEKFFNDYEAAIEELSEAATPGNVVANPGISVKLSALHPRYEILKRDRVFTELLPRIKALAVKAKKADIGFSIDAEEADRLDISLDLIDALLRDRDLGDWAGFGVVVQAYQRRASYVIEWLADAARNAGRSIMVRLVKGAYWDAEIKRAQEIGLASYPVFTRKASTDVSFLACARLLLDNADVIYPQFATHNALSAEYVEEMAKDIAKTKGIDPIRFEFQRLHGMGEALHDGLLERGHASRIYAPVGGHKELLPYLVRRLLENGANSSFVNQLFDPKAPIDEIIADPIAEISALDEKSNDAIPAPRDLFDGKRLSAVGFDETDTRTATQLEKAARLTADLSKVAAPVVAFDYDRASLPTREIRNPANTDELVATVSEANEPMVGLAVEHAAIAAGPWAATAPAEKSDVLTKAADLIEQRADDFFALAVKEAGKTLPDAIAEVREAVDFLRYYANQSSGLEGDPLGVIACISPWNFPLAIFLGQVSAAIAAGSVVIAKPAEQTPLIAIAATRLLHEAGLPRGVLQLLPGDGDSIGAPLVQHAGVDGVIFTGSTPVAQKINQSLRERSPNALLIAETGGINAMIIDSTALLEEAVKDVVASAFQSAGQRCSACRVVLVQDDIVDRFEAMLAGAMDELSLGDPAHLSTDVGPLIDPDALGDAADYVAEAKKQFRTLAAAEMPLAPKGHFLPPIAFGLDSLKDVKREVFAPVLHVIPFKAGALETTIADVNGLGFGLTMGLHTRVDDTMHLVAERARVGNLYVNRNQIGAVVGVQPFGGEGLSGTGPKAGGPHYLQAIRRHKSMGEERMESPSVAFSETPTTLLSQRLSVLKQKLDSWRTRDDRSQLFFKAAAAAKNKRAKLASEILSRAATLAKTLEDPQALPGPTGEANTLTLKPRGIVLCLGVDEAALSEQLAKSLAAGNAIVTTEQLASDIAGFVATGAGGDILPILGTPIWDGTSHNLPLDIIQSPSVSGVAFDGRQQDQKTLAQLLAARAGAITPLLSADAPLWRYCVEVTLTINTTAAGGDVNLLSLPS